MESIPDFWRTEVLHPLFVHFPISLLLVGTLFKMATFSNKGKFLDSPGSILLIAGTVGGWLAIYTGELADGIVSRTLCDPTILKDHQNSSYTMIWIFTTAVALDLASLLKFIKFKEKLVKIGLVLLLSLGCGFLIYVGHLGAELVYQQAAGVYRPTQNCAEFN